jgi:PQQ-dependent dehydrogenase (s-GDH family)
MKQQILLSILFFSVTAVFAQPANDACVNAINITPVTSCGASSYNIQNATISAPTNTQGTTYDAWFKFTTPAGTSNVSITIPSSGSGLSSTNFFVEAFSAGTCPFTTINSLATANEATGLSLTGLSPNTEYYFRVFSTTNPTGNPSSQWNYSVCVSYVAPIANDLCSSPTNITAVTTCGATANQTLLNATTTGSPTNAAGTTKDVWYTFTTPANIRNVLITASGLGPNLTTSNTFVEAFASGSCVASVFTGTSIGTSASGGPTSLSLTNLTPSTQYYFRVFTTGTATGGTNTDWGFSICVSYSSVPSNDDCSGAITLTSGITNSTGKVLNATASGSVVGCASGTPDDDVWYSFTPTQVNASITVTAGSTLNTSGAMIQLYSGTCAGLASIACGQNSINATGLTTGSTYYIRVYSSGSYSTTPLAATVDFSFSILVSESGGVGIVKIVGSRMNEVFKETTLNGVEDAVLGSPYPAGNLYNPWEITYGPDGYLWITEARGYRIRRMDPVTGTATTVMFLSRGATGYLSNADTAIYNCKFDSTFATFPQGGMMGIAVHPDFMNATSPKKFVYVGYVQKYDSVSVTTNGGHFFKSRIVRFTYDEGTNRLISPLTLCDTIPGSNDHNSGRMIIAPVDGVNYLFYSVGDMGAGNYLNKQRIIRSQNPVSYEGKILRFRLEPDNDPGAYDKWIPDSIGVHNNPFNGATQSAVYTTGVRNNQGFAYNPFTNKLYGAEHGQFADDEINIIEAGKNYGHPLVEGYNDGNYNGCKAGSSSGKNPLIVSEAANATAIGADFRGPLYTFFPAPNTGSTTSITSIYTSTTGDPGGNNAWLSVAHSGMDIYTSSFIPGWQNSLMTAAMKKGKFFKLKLNSTGDVVMPTPAGSASPVNDTVGVFFAQNRYRDLAISADGKTIFVAIDKDATTSGPTAASPQGSRCPGCIKKFEFLGYNDNGGLSSIPTSIPIGAGFINGKSNGTTTLINSDNNNLWVPITDSLGNILAEIKANGNNLGTITSCFYVRSGSPVRQTVAASKYLNRNITITVQNQPTPGNPVNVRLYLSASELADMISTAGSGVTSITDLGIFKNNDACGSSISATPTSQTIIRRVDHGSFGHVIEASIASFSSFYFMSTSASLPVNLITFTGRSQNDASLLQWVVDNQDKVDHYVIERSSNNVDFNKIGSVNVKGINTEKINYNFSDLNASKIASSLFYRLKIEDIDGTFKYSNVINITFGSVTLTTVNVYPNPVKEKASILINSANDETAKLKIVDNTGRIINQRNLTIRKGRNNFEIDMSELPTGLYYIDINGTTFNQKIKLIKQ